MPDDQARQTDQLRTRLGSMAERADRSLQAVLQALESGDGDVAGEVVDADAQREPTYAHIQSGVLAAIALHHPIGRDLRTLTGLLHASLHVERMTDLTVSMARTVQQASQDRADEDVTHQLIEMGDLARAVAQRSVQAFLGDDTSVADEAERLDDAVDRLDSGIFERLVRLAADDETRLPWATRMIHLTRQFERYADHGVDVAEQAVFVRSGEPVRLRRSSHA